MNPRVPHKEGRYSDKQTDIEVELEVHEVLALSVVNWTLWMFSVHS